MATKDEKVAAEAHYLDTLRKSSKEPGVFRKLNIEDSDNGTIKKIKNKINHIVAQELARCEFKEKVDTELLVASTTKEVLSHKNFYFGVDQDKRLKNNIVRNFKAPGNKYHKPQYILPHEHVNVCKYIDTEDLSQDKLFEIYGLYALLVDMHIA